MGLRKSLFWLLVIPLFALLGERTAHAGIVVTTSSSAPSDHVLTNYSVGYDNFAWPVKWTGDATSDRRECAQSFLVSAANDWSIDKITVKVREFGTSVVNQPYTLEMWTVSNAADTSGNALVSTQSATFPASGLTAGYWTFDIADVTLTKGNYYVFVIGFNSGPDSERYFNLVNAYSGTDLFPDGRMFFRTGTPPSWIFDAYNSNLDFDFSVQGSPVPEPSAVALLATGVASLLFMAWRRRKRS